MTNASERGLELASVALHSPWDMQPCLRSRRQRLCAVVVGAVLFWVLLQASSGVVSALSGGSVPAPIAPHRWHGSYRPVTPHLDFKADIRSSLAQYSPWYPVDAYRPPPPGCEIDQVNILQRHDARYPTSTQGEAIKRAVTKIQSAPSFKNFTWDFIRHYVYNLGEEDLVLFGAMEAFDAGQLVYPRYQKLVSEQNIPFVRSTDSPRVVQSATNWTAGFAYASGYKYQPSLSVVFSSRGNNTLKNMCDAAGESDKQVAEWLAVYGPPVVARLNAAAPGANITINDLFGLFSLCSFDSVANARVSQWCDLFSPEEFRGFEYYADLSKYYGSTGPAQPLGPAQGVGYVNELLARLTESPVVDSTQTNSSLNSSPLTFPLDRSVYADFTHDNQMVAVFGALGLYADVAPLNTTSLDTERRWRLSQMVLFSGRMVTERLQCQKNQRKKGRYVRILVNELVQPLGFCGAGDGICTLEAFAQSQGYARHNGYGDFEKCFPITS